MIHENEVNKKIHVFFLRVEIRTAITDRERDELCESMIEYSVLECSNEDVEGMLAKSERTEKQVGLSLLTVSVQKKETLRKQLLDDT